jgi:hypothetical protein
MLSEYPVVKSFIVDKETPSYFPFLSLGVSSPTSWPVRGNLSSKTNNP